MLDHTGIFNNVAYGPQLSDPVDRWLQLPMSWSLQFVRWVLTTLVDLTDKPLIVDPFCGTGATLLAAQSLGLASFGFDSDPLCVLASHLKVNARSVPEAISEVGNLWDAICKDQKTSTDNLVRRAVEQMSASSLIAQSVAVTMLAAATRMADVDVRILHRKFEMLKRDCANLSKVAPPASVALADSSQSDTWKMLQLGHGRRRPIVLCSPPHPRSRGRGVVHLSIDAWATSLATSLRRRGSELDSEKTAGLDPFEKSGETLGHTVVKNAIAACKPNGIVIVEYETTEESGDTFLSIANSITNLKGIVIQRVRTYRTSPDERPGVIEGGLCVVKTN